MVCVTVILGISIFSFAVYQATDPYRGYRETTPPEPITVESFEPREDLVQHPITGEWITKEEAEREAELVKAMLCSLGEERYCG